ncbi:glycoside hydrolase family 3 protein [Clostridium oryzae]|uniref:beta-glucosidase n=1 Tax=Clostridium oryzae TaxID=1450648 RepID=A0A1V4ID25_9CLOT|nr:glycoside hydrolase family 3 N-terminal domain-containing protein [Clostridium oryzae]OPJ57908.1 beta-glucosidase BoGH3B precursor [Clostridium oryzae]
MSIDIRSKWRKVSYPQYNIIINEGGKTIGYSVKSNIDIIESDGYAFKDLNKNGKLDPYEDWRLPLEERLNDLVKQMSIDDIAGLMLYSAHQSVSSDDNVFAAKFRGTYDGKSLEESGKNIWELSDQQKQFLQNDHLRHVLVTVVENAETVAKWNNQLQAFAENLKFGIPVNISSDPRHTPEANTEFDAGSGGDISKWPQPLGFAATFDPELVRNFGRIAAREYRAMGISTALSPQVDLATEPRWMRFDGTFGEDSKLTTDMAEAYCDGFQTSENGSWGDTSVNAMVKHWPGGGSGESGRDAHFGYGKFAVYPGNNFQEHLKPFTDGAFKLKHGTNKASAVMPYYTISYGQDVKNNENVGNGYSSYIIKDLLRDKYGYDGVVCTDWVITKDSVHIDQFLSGKCWGTEKLTVAQRHYKVIMAGVDQFGGNNEIQPVLDAYQIGVKEHGEEWMRKRFELSAKRLLRNIFQCGLFENPYTDPDYASKEVGKLEYIKAGYEAQQKSIVLLKNHNQLLPITDKKKVYIPKRRISESKDWFGNSVDAHEEFPIEPSILNRYYELVESCEKADFAIVFVGSPKSSGFINGEYVPITLQYGEYTAQNARQHSIAKDENDEIVDRNYFGKTNTADNKSELEIIIETRKAMGSKPVIAALSMSNPTIVSEFEPYVDALVVDFHVQRQVILDIIKGTSEPSGLLPFQMPKNMETVENQNEDAAHDMECYVDSDGNRYDFAYGMNYRGIIDDERVKKYIKAK